jgi:glucose/arabinose dehydrogenase
MRQTLTTFFSFLAILSSSHADIGVKKIAEGFQRPVWVGAPKVSTKQLWVMEQHGAVTAIKLDSGDKKLMLDIHDRVSREGNEEGMLGLAFAPDFQRSGRFYINYTDKEHFTCISRFVLKNGKVDAAQEEVILRYKQDFQNHNGGWLDFGPDGMLYIGNGDGGAANDPKQRAQDMESLLGKILRLDVSPAKGYAIPQDNPFAKSKKAKPEIWSCGLRNPWRCSFDRATGDFWIADVGQNHWEEINVIPFRDAAGANFGWRLREGEVATPAGGVGGEKPSPCVDPIYVYRHGSGPTEGFSVTGGFVYRGPIKSLQGRYIFADYQNPRIWSFVAKKGKATDFQDHTDALQPEGGKIRLIPSFGEGTDGSLYLVDHSGPIYEVIEK